MKEHPIIFSTPMIKALFNTKPNTWPAKPLDPSKPFKSMMRRVVKPQPDKDDSCVNYCTVEGFQASPEAAEEIWAQTEKGESVQLKPKYQEGDILWVRETFTKDPSGAYIYRADSMFDNCGKGDISWAWTSPLFLPREAARLFLEVKNVRIERLFQITDEDAITEGTSDILRFRYLWDAVNAKRGYGWYENPWVWVIEFIRAA